jgi:Uncharacterized conserved protein
VREETKVCIVFEGRDTAGKGGVSQADHRAGEPSRVPGRRAAGTDGPREVPDVHPALPAAFSGWRRGRDLRPQLVQPRRGRAGDGLLLRGRAFRFLRLAPLVERTMVDSGIILLKYWLEVGQEEQTRESSRGSTTRARSGNCRRWTSSPTAAGMTTPGPVTRCSPRPTRNLLRGTSLTQTIRSAPG